MPRFLIHHRHEPRECGAVYASFRGFDSPLRHRPALASCPCGEHAIWWSVDAPSGSEALTLVPAFVAARATATQVREVHIP
jgi:hypothetical protein